MRQTLMVATMAVMMSCSPNGNTPWDANHDGLITPCEGLNSYACDSTPGCEPVPTRCATALAETDGTSTPCVGAETCQPTTPPIFDCSHLSLSDCATVARCEVVTRQTACDVNGTTHNGVAQRDPAPAPPYCGQTVQVCANRAPTPCEQLSTDVCLAQPGCALEGSGSTCDIACGSGNFSCPPCAVESLRCVTVPPPDVCGARDPNTCSIDGRCVLEFAATRCESGGGAVPCAPGDPTCGAPIACSPPAPRCVPAPPPDVCGSRDENTCTVDGRCVLEVSICDATCSPDGSCPPCANPTARCVPAPVHGVCDGRDANTCAIDGQCVLIPGPECLCSPDGVCPPCAAPSVMCVPAPPDVCAGRDLTSCASDGQCMVMAWACPAICKPDGNGGCEPCNAPPAACVPVWPQPQPVPSRCEGLDRLSCAAVGCEVIELGLACPAVCIDDGHGGCVPCKDFVCNDPATGGTGGGTPPPQP